MFEPMITTDILGVIHAWVEGKNARTYRDTLCALQGKLISYDLKIGLRTPAGVCIIVDYANAEDRPGQRRVSQLTADHVAIAKKFADTVFHPLVSDRIPLFREEYPF